MKVAHCQFDCPVRVLTSGILTMMASPVALVKALTSVLWPRSKDFRGSEASLQSVAGNPAAEVFMPPPIYLLLLPHQPCPDSLISLQAQTSRFIHRSRWFRVLLTAPIATPGMCGTPSYESGETRSNSFRNSRSGTTHFLGFTGSLIAVRAFRYCVRITRPL